MLKNLLLLGLGLASISAQSPLTTLFASNNGGSVGGGVFFNLATGPLPVTLRALHTNLGSAPGTQGTIEVWIRTGTHVGFENDISQWALLATGSVIAAGIDVPSRCVLEAPATLPAASLVGVCLNAIGVAHRYTNGNGSNQIHATAELTLTAGSALDVCFGRDPPSAPRVWNGRLFYGNEQFATASASGDGCPEPAAASFYEFFDPNGFDLSGQKITMVPNGQGGYTVTLGSAAVIAPAPGSGLALVDESVRNGLDLGFSFSIPGHAPTPQIAVGDNGYIHVSPSGTPPDYTPTPAEALGGSPRVFALWTDLVPDGATNVDNVYFETLTPASARITWWNMREYGTANVSTVQMELFATGQICIVYGNCSVTNHRLLVGFSPGSASRDPGNRDISIGSAFNTRSDAFGLEFKKEQDPVLGTTITLRVQKAPPATLFGVVFLSSTLIQPLDLAFLGAPRCYLHVSPLLASLTLPISGTAGQLPVAIPNQPALLGGLLPMQAATLSPGVNQLGLATSNALQLVFGNQ